MCTQLHDCVLVLFTKGVNMSVQIKFQINFPALISFVCLCWNVSGSTVLSLSQCLFCSWRILMPRVNEARLSRGASLRTAFNSSLVWRQPLASTVLTVSSSKNLLERGSRQANNYIIFNMEKFKCISALLESMHTRKARYCILHKCYFYTECVCDVNLFISLS